MTKAKRISKANQSPTYRYEACRFGQRGGAAPKVVMFHAAAGEILKWARVQQLTEKTVGPQRERRDARVHAIAKFLSADEKNIIPTAVVMAFRKGATSFVANGAERGGFTVRTMGDVPAAYIVDGQHRVYGIAHFNPAAHVAVVGLLDADDVEQAFQFLVINNKSSRVPVSHAKALLSKMQDTALAPRLKAARLSFDAHGIKDVDIVNTDHDSPFYKTIDWTTTPAAKRMIPATAIEMSLAYMGGQGIPEYDDRDIRRSVFLAIWREIRSTWETHWNQGSRLVSKVAIYCLTRFIVDLIANWAENEDLDIELADLEDIGTQTKKILKNMHGDFWTAPWAENAQGGFDTNQGRERVLAALKQLHRNGKNGVPWHTDIDIVEVEAAEREPPPGKKSKK